MPHAPWSHAFGIDAVLADWKQRGAIQQCFAADRLFEAGEPSYAPMPPDVAPGLRQALAHRGITHLYSHQAEAIDSAQRGQHLVIATPTASGKSLCFHLPVLQALADDPAASALFLYPTKALSRDQENALQQLAKEAGIAAGPIVYDGDTPGDARRSARERSRIILTNPDMLHSGVLPSHPKWASLFQGLRFVVLDELHTYRGVFGSHMAHVIARLRRVAAFHGSFPTFICATATIGNPAQHAARLLGVAPEQVHLVDRSGAPRSSRHFFLYNPPIVNEDLGIRASALKQSVMLAGDLILARVPTLVFGPSRNTVEVMLKYLRARTHGQLDSKSIMAYRGGYLPKTRRAVEAGLREGTIVGVVATNALELGIDIGDLDAVICVGYPGSVAGTWQRFGRAGRRGKSSIAVMVCSSSPVDQFLARDPDYLLRAGAEEARIEPENVEVLIQHLKCAAFEAPFELSSSGSRPAAPLPAQGEHYSVLDAPSTREALEYLGKHGLVHESGGKFHWSGEAFPANSVSLRNIGWDNFVIIDVATGKSLAELDWRAAHTMLHEQAIYQHDAEQFQVERLDYDNHKAYVRRVEPDYYTTALTYRIVSVLDQNASRSQGSATLGWGEVKVIEKVTGYKKIKFFTHENAGYGDVHLPEIQLHTTSFWLTIPEELIGILGLPRATVVDGLRGVGQALETIATLALMCEPRDLNRTLGDGGNQATVEPGRDPFGGRTGGLNPTVFIFDAHPGGVGLAQRLFERCSELVERTRLLISGCSCQTGCPACVGPTELDGPRKRAALSVLDLLSSADRTPVAPSTHRP